MNDEEKDGTEERSVQISLRIPAELDRRIVEQARARLLQRSDIVREALLAHMRRQQEEETAA